VLGRVRIDYLLQAELTAGSNPAERDHWRTSCIGYHTGGIGYHTGGIGYHTGGIGYHTGGVDYRTGSASRSSIAFTARICGARWVW
jgi:hypothetical protein